MIYILQSHLLFIVLLLQIYIVNVQAKSSGSNNTQNENTSTLTFPSCKDDPLFTFLTAGNEKERHCTYLIIENKSAAVKRRRAYCNKDDVNTACQWSCGKCADSIMDDPTYTFSLHSNLLSDEKSCTWIGKPKSMQKIQRRRSKTCPRVFESKAVKDSCRLSCANYEVPAIYQQRKKMGLILGNSGVLPQKAFEHFQDISSWTYNFKQSLEPDIGEFVDKNGMEYVPMISKPWLHDRCIFEEDICMNNFPTDKNCSASSARICSVQDVIESVTEGVQGRKNGVPVKYLIGFNEPYMDGKFLEPQKAVYFWTKFIQPAAKANNLKLISPTLMVSPRSALRWFADFLKMCHDDSVCDPDLIHAFNLHLYTCKEAYWRRFFQNKFLFQDNSKFEMNLLSLIGNQYNGKDWEQYVLARKVWVTETHCGRAEGSPYLSSEDICKIVTGNSSKYGKGSVFAMNTLENIERYAWWTVWRGIPDYIQNMLTYKDGQLTPAGRGVLDPLNPSVDCSFRGDRIQAKDAVLSGLADHIQCKATGTTMLRIRSIGGKAVGMAEFKVSVSQSGNYAINVSLMNVQKKASLSVSVNSQRPQNFQIQHTGERWCVYGGKPTVVPIELRHLKAGVNDITFTVNENELTVFIEWIQVVPKLSL